MNRHRFFKKLIFVVESKIEKLRGKFRGESGARRKISFSSIIKMKGSRRLSHCCATFDTFSIEINRTEMLMRVDVTTSLTV